MKMKKSIMLVILFLMGIGSAKADKDIAITPDRLPKQAQLFIKTHFPNEQISLAKKERDLFEVRYEVVLGNSTKLEFLSNGDWEDVDCRYKEVPATILPEFLQRVLDSRYPEAKVVEISRDRRDYEVKLSNGLELTFTPDGQLIDIDD